VKLFTKESAVRFIAASKPLIIVLLLLSLVWLSACSGDQPAGAGVAPAVEVALVDEEVATPVATETAAVVPEQPAAESESADECLHCHTDKDMLVDTASPEEEVISENEGEG
jgi:hypothetical protein